MTVPDRGWPRIGSMCSGFGGLDMGVQAVLGGEVVWHAEMNPSAAQILAHHWPRDAKSWRYHRS
ncbi:hypothetical protein ACIHEI_28065 [Kitasatospora sp. NPDC051984]|uniref:hypothetical protein n=1 Tax=Kitasatospora sp. NPDC051984 TaxID=3364059 RepID=UPI0037C89F55